MNDSIPQEQTLSITMLMTKGYTVAAAARRVGRSHNHVRLILLGVRRSKKIEQALMALPFRPLQLRERVTH